MDKQAAVAALGEDSLVRPARLREALRANDRLKLYLTVLQAAAAHAARPAHASADLARDIAAAGIADHDRASWLRELPAAAEREDDRLRWPGWQRLCALLAEDLRTMALPVTEGSQADASLGERVRQWTLRLQEFGRDDLLDPPRIDALARGGAPGDDGFHRLVMDLHQALNRAMRSLGDEEIAGAHVWQLAADGSDRPRVEAFMRGLERTRGLKLDHPGLDTSATRDGDQLLIQNDIGTNDAHVLVVKVGERGISLTYSDLHATRFAFFQALLAQIGATWSRSESRHAGELNEGHAYWVGSAAFEAQDDTQLLAQLEGIGARIVFLIDWNRARKRLRDLVDKELAVAVLTECARREVGHRAWLEAGGERLVWNAMSAQGESIFRLGDRLDDVLGAEAARDFLVEVLLTCQDAAQRGRPTAFVADELRLLLARRLQGRDRRSALLQEHAGWCHALAQALRDGLAHGVDRDAEAAARLSQRAKGWERQADELVVRARSLAERQPSWAPLARLVERADDIADALEEAAFVLSLVADHEREGWGTQVHDGMQLLAEAVLQAVQDHVKAVAIGSAGGSRDADDAGQALDALWRVVQAERQCDELLRSVRRSLARHVRDAALLHLGNEFAAALELASDHLLALGHQLRHLTLQPRGALA